MHTNISVGRADKGHLWLEYYIEPSRDSGVLTIVWLAEDDGFPFLRELANLSEGDKIHPFTEDAFKVCRLFTKLGLLNEHPTFNGSQYSYASEEAQSVVQHASEHLHTLRNQELEKDVSLSLNCGHWIKIIGGNKILLKENASEEKAEDWLELISYEQFTQEKITCFVIPKETICPPKCQPILM